MNQNSRGPCSRGCAASATFVGHVPQHSDYSSLFSSDSLSLWAVPPDFGQHLTRSEDRPTRRERGGRNRSRRCRGSCCTCTEVMSGRASTSSACCFFFQSRFFHQRVFWLYATKLSDDCFFHPRMHWHGRQAWQLRSGEIAAGILGGASLGWM